MSKPSFIVVIGASAGGLNALSEMVQHLKKGIDTAYCIVLHLSRKGIGDYVVHTLQKVTSLSCSIVIDGESIEKDHIYVARPNQHMLVKDGRFLLGAGPEENRWRPSIDVLFRSAAVAYGSQAIGVVLSGLLDDGTSGMWAIKRSGGQCIVQDPDEAEYPDMPMSIINHMEADFVTTLVEIGPIIEQLTNSIGDLRTAAPDDVISESKIAERTAVGIDDVRKLNVEQSIFACPDCGGGLWDVKNDVIKRYRCHIGHAYTEKDLILRQAMTAGNTLWVALRMMEERKHLLRKMEVDNTKKGYKSVAVGHHEKQVELDRHIDRLKEILRDLQNHDTA
ncbi:chemotaxis protein CheB [Flavitalea sp.]|nr:chemotaxis protein CheB [Flavitalea sp.]